ncbi:META domain-containing protein [Streptomyces sp. HNM0663]|uniref:META domain-containing protein n=1 Tax=Streptomyces chengmaiensis TaxID=3040919 RepID=A0ABT6HXB3_9ACTN|nr:META domain-containing protein [Streptomyces chengmaiensis]MDH2393230.1 META domain-containing protein [Streptomyces chengmaiensis]
MRKQLSLPAAVLAAVLSAALTACGTDAGSGPGGSSVAEDPALTGIRWSVESVTVEGEKTANPTDAHITLTDEGRAEGSYGCNRFGADATVEGDTVTVGQGTMTEIGCEKPVMQFEELLRKAFSGTLTAAVDDGRLTLTTRQGDTIALTSDPAVPDAPLTGTKWTVTSLVSGETVSSAPAGAEQKAHLTLDDEGTMRGSLGCNTFSVAADVDAAQSTITLSKLATTRKLCEGPEAELETAVLRVLEQDSVTYEIEQRALTLTAENGRGLTATAPKS